MKPSYLSENYSETSSETSPKKLRNYALEFHQNECPVAVSCFFQIIFSKLP